MKKWAVLFLLLLGTAIVLPPCVAQKPAADVKPQVATEDTNLDNFLQVLRSNLRTAKVEIVTENMQLTDKEAAVFWPIYRNYEVELNKLNDQKVALLKDYATNYEKMSPAKAKELAEKSFTFEQDQVELKRKYFREFEKVMPANRVAKFFQIDRRLDLLVNLKMASEVPIID